MMRRMLNMRGSQIGRKVTQSNMDRPPADSIAARL
jgi:hypothetical protein